MTSMWAVLQDPLDQAVRVEGDGIGSVTYHDAIPPVPPASRARKILSIGEYNNDLILLGRGRFQRWTRDGQACLVDMFHPLIYGPHAAVQFDENILICSAGLDAFVLVNEQGETVWEWWAHANGLCEPSPWFDRTDRWRDRVISGRDYCVPDSLHFNSAVVHNGGILTAAMKRHWVMRIVPGQTGFEVVANVPDEGLHSPILDGGTLIYGTRRGVVVGDRKLLNQFEWVKQIRRIGERFVFTHDGGVVVADNDWNIAEELPMPRPFQMAFVELDMAEAANE